MKKKIPLVEDNVELDLMIEVGRKIFNDHYIAGFVWRVTDDNGKVYSKGDGISWQDSLEKGRASFKKN